MTIRSVTLTSPLTSAQLAEMIGMTEQQMMREGVDLDLADAARWLIERKINLDRRGDVEGALEGMAHHPQGFVDAAIVLARTGTLTASP